MDLPEISNDQQRNARRERAPKTWKESVDSEIDQLGWRDATRVEQPGDDVAIYMVDTQPTEDLVFHPEGPATFSLSTFVDGAGTLSIDGAKPLLIEPGTAVFFACDRITRGQNRIDAGLSIFASSTFAWKNPCLKSLAVFPWRASGSRNYRTQSA